MVAILVVEEEAAIALDLERLIRHMGHTVNIAHSGEDALRTAESKHPDPVITASKLIELCIRLNAQLQGEIRTLLIT
jgi:CheY-like chemotaxis protein